jgi:hypothetical protein
MSPQKVRWFSNGQSVAGQRLRLVRTSDSVTLGATTTVVGSTNGYVVFSFAIAIPLTGGVEYALITDNAAAPGTTLIAYGQGSTTQAVSGLSTPALDFTSSGGSPTAWTGHWVPFELRTNDSPWSVMAIAGPGYTRTTTIFTTASLANNAIAAGGVTIASGYRLLRIATNQAARVRLYTTTAKRDADSTRAFTTSPTGDHGVVLDYATSALVLAADLSPVVDGYDGKSTPDGVIPYSVTNLATTGAVTVTLTWLRTE